MASEWRAWILRTGWILRVTVSYETISDSQWVWLRRLGKYIIFVYICDHLHPFASIYTVSYIYIHLHSVHLHYIYIYICILYTFMYIYIHLYTLICIHLHPFAYIYKIFHTFTFIYIYFNLHTSTSICTHLHPLASFCISFSFYASLAPPTHWSSWMQNFGSLDHDRWIIVGKYFWFKHEDFTYEQMDDYSLCLSDCRIPGSTRDHNSIFKAISLQTGPISYHLGPNIPVKLSYQ